MTIEAASERKHVTVLFADVRGSMALAEQMDVEDWRALIDRFSSRSSRTACIASAGRSSSTPATA